MNEFQVGDIVKDDLTGKTQKVLKVIKDDNGNVCIQLDNDYLGGLRHPWEVSDNK